MTDFSIFTDEHLAVAEARHAWDFARQAAYGFLPMATDTNRILVKIRAEITRRARPAEFTA